MELESTLENVKKVVLRRIKEFMALLNQRARVRESLKYPLVIYYDLLEAHIVLPAKDNDRIRQQQGAFIYPCYTYHFGASVDRIGEEIDKSIASKASEKIFRICATQKESIRKELSKLGITAGFIYPDIEHRSQTIISQLKDRGI